MGKRRLHVTAMPLRQKDWEEFVVAPARMQVLTLSKQARGADMEVEDLLQVLSPTIP